MQRPADPVEVLRNDANGVVYFEGIPLDQKGYREGDVLFVRRAGFGQYRMPMSQVAYHHAMVVTKVDQGQVVEGLDLDPLINGADPNRPVGDLFSAAMNDGLPATLPRVVTPALFKREFGPYGTLDGHVIQSRLPDDPEALASFRARIEKARVTKRQYNLMRYNCQHFATEMATGVPSSPDVTAFTGAMRRF